LPIGPPLPIGHNQGVIFQQPGPDPQAAAGVVTSIQHVGWVDITALGVLSLFFVLGLFKGLFWQVSRFGILLVAYVVSARFGARFGGALHHWTSPTPDEPTSETSLYLAYVLIFLGVLVSLSLVALMIQKLVRKAGLTFYDRLGGGILGTATGACVVLFLLLVMNMFFPESRAADAASKSQSMKWWSWAIDRLGSAVPNDLRKVMSLAPLQSASPQPGGTDTTAPHDNALPHDNGTTLPHGKAGGAAEHAPAQQAPRSPATGKG
jgi:membrane protein required for colicin V production